jgi:predicted DNA-binding protein (MmcQ/YjbR family)
MNLESLRAYCLSLPHADEKVQWEDDLLFTIGGKIFVVTPLEPSRNVATLKPDPEHRLELLEMEGVEPAPYLARAGWVSVRDWNVLRDPEWRDLVSESYRMVLAKLPKKLQASLGGQATAPEKNTKAQSGPKPKADGKAKAKITVKPATATKRAAKGAAPRKRAAKASARTSK